MRLLSKVRVYNIIFPIGVLLTLLQACTPSYSLKDYMTLPERVENKEEGQSTLEAAIPDYIDKELMMNRDQFTDAIYGRDGGYSYDKQKESSKEDLLPELPEEIGLLSEPEIPKFGNGKLITLSITEDIPLKDVLIEISRLSEIDIELDTQISGGIILRVTNKSLEDVIDRIARLAGLRYSVRNGVLKVEIDKEYVVNYPVSMLNIDRSNQGSISISTSVLGSTEDSEGSDSITLGSTNAINSSYDGNIWSSIESGVRSILNEGLSLNSDPENPGQSNSSSNFISVNRQAGLITVMTTSRKHDRIREYLNRIILSAKSQVLIEAKILEVTLDDKYRAGINWSAVIDDQGLNASLDVLTGDTEAFTFSASNLFGRNLSAAINLTEEFGTSKTLSSPRILATNNQQAVLTFAENQVYFTLDIEREDEDATDTTASSTTFTFESELQTIPIGVILTLQPSIDLENNEVIMNIRPTLSRITEQVADPGVELFAQQEGLVDVTSEVPVVEVREMDSVLKVRSGEVMVIGGLMEERSINTDTGIPGFASLPAVGNFFKQSSKDTTVVETVIFLKATIVKDNSVGIQDQHFYNVFSSERRPFTF